MDRENVIRDLRYLKSFGRVSNNPQLTEIAESAIELLKEQQQIINSLKSDLQETLKVVSEQSNVVRCKDCKHWREHDGHCPYNSIFTHKDWYCADGEWKE